MLRSRLQIAVITKTRTKLISQWHDLTSWNINGERTYRTFSPISIYLSTEKYTYKTKVTISNLKSIDKLIQGTQKRRRVWKRVLRKCEHFLLTSPDSLSSYPVCWADSTVKLNIACVVELFSIPGTSEMVNRYSRLLLRWNFFSLRKPKYMFHGRQMLLYEKLSYGEDVSITGRETGKPQVKFI